MDKKSRGTCRGSSLQYLLSQSSIPPSIQQVPGDGMHDLTDNVVQAREAVTTPVGKPFASHLCVDVPQVLVPQVFADQATSADKSEQFECPHESCHDDTP